MILVIGASGLVGSHLIKQLSKTNQKVIATYHSSKPEQLLQNITWQQLDILDMVAVEKLMQQATHVYHCAALVSFTREDKNLLHKINVNGTVNIVNACINANIQKLVYVSSVATLDRFKDGELIDERFTSNKPVINSEYAKSKMAAESEVWRAIGEGLNTVIINPSIILGAGNWSNSSTAIFKNCYNEFPWYSKGGNGFVNVEDVVNAMILLMNSAVTSERYIINGYNVSYKKLFDTIAENFNKKKPNKLATPLIAGIAWRVEKIKSFFTGNKPLLTKETAQTAQKNIAYDNSKFLKTFPGFEYSDYEKSIQDICNKLKLKYGLN